MDYYQPPAIVQMVSQSQIPTCQSIFEKSQEGIPQQYTLRGALNEEALKFFPSKDDLALVDIVNETMSDFFSKLAQRAMSHNYYRLAGSKRDWDAVLSYFKADGMPRSLYVIIGDVNPKINILNKRDLIFHFYHNPIDVAQDNFNIGILRMYTPDVAYTCAPDLRNYFDSHLNKKQKVKQRR